MSEKPGSSRDPESQVYRQNIMMSRHISPRFKAAYIKHLQRQRAQRQQTSQYGNGPGLLGPSRAQQQPGEQVASKVVSRQHMVGGLSWTATSSAASTTAPAPMPLKTAATAQANLSAAQTRHRQVKIVKEKCHKFLANLLELASYNGYKHVEQNTRMLIQDLIDDIIMPEEFCIRLERLINASPQPNLVGFLKKSLPYLRNALSSKEFVINGIRPPQANFHNSLPTPGLSAPVVTQQNRIRRTEAMIPATTVVQPTSTLVTESPTSAAILRLTEAVNGLRPLQPIQVPQRAEARKISIIEKWNDSLVHAAQCQNVTCQRGKCQRMKSMIEHIKICKKRTGGASGDCPICKHTVPACRYHAKHCQKTMCAVPFCYNMKQQIKRQQQLQSPQLPRQSMATMASSRPTAAVTELRWKTPQVGPSMSPNNAMKTGKKPTSPSTSEVAVPQKDVSLRTDCVICLDAQSTHAFIPCGHRCCCSGCAEMWTKQKLSNEAPILHCVYCNTQAASIIHIIDVQTAQ